MVVIWWLCSKVIHPAHLNLNGKWDLVLFFKFENGFISMVHFWLSWTPEVLSFWPLVPEPLTVSLSYKGLYSWDDEWMQLMTRQDGKLAGRWQSKTRIRTFAPVCTQLKWHSHLLWFLKDFDGASVALCMKVRFCIGTAQYGSNRMIFATSDI